MSYPGALKSTLALCWCVVDASPITRSWLSLGPVLVTAKTLSKEAG